MKKNNKPVIGVTLGDAAGIGSELVAKVASKGELTNHGIPLIIGDCPENISFGLVTNPCCGWGLTM